MLFINTSYASCTFTVMNTLFVVLIIHNVKAVLYYRSGICQGVEGVPAERQERHGGGWNGRECGQDEEEQQQ